MKILSGRIAVVTGGASGIGFGLAKRFLEEGMKVVIADIDQGQLNSAVHDLGKIGNIAGERVDVSDPRQIQSLADSVMARHGAVHILCNNAGVGGLQRMRNTSLASWEWILGVNLMGTINGCRIFIPMLEQQEEAHLVNTSSVAGLVYSPYHHPYNVSKAGVIALSEGLDFEFRQDGVNIGVSILIPGFVRSRMYDDERNAPPGVAPRSSTDEDITGIRQAIEKSVTAGMNPDKVADLVVSGIRDRKLHIVTHPEWLDLVRKRMEAIVQEKPLRLDYPNM